MSPPADHLLWVAVSSPADHLLWVVVSSPANHLLWLGVSPPADHLLWLAVSSPAGLLLQMVLMNKVCQTFGNMVEELVARTLHHLCEHAAEWLRENNSIKQIL